MVRIHSQRVQQAAYGHLAIKVAKIRERIFGQLNFDVDMPKSVLQLEGLTARAKENEIEHHFWCEEIALDEIAAEDERHVGDVLIRCGATGYLGCFRCTGHRYRRDKDTIFGVERRLLLRSTVAIEETCRSPHSSFAIQECSGNYTWGGAGTRLYPLTKKRGKPAVPLDIPVSNCLNSNISKIYVLTQFNYASLNRHLLRAYASNMGGYKNKGVGNVVDTLRRYFLVCQPLRKFYIIVMIVLTRVLRFMLGTADAVRQYLWLFKEHNVMEYLILVGNHLYRMDYEKFIQAHRETDADITVAALPMDEKRATAFGLMKIDEEGRIIEFLEKPKGE
ncbi:hypothetical protein GIB67_029467 [Kingdonia uniflora]|uniref:glucose-1-phosphate adenylyltransferase n=1 Tax=Kingdonia uniflora TaxID=39325 RepID=A0A7J7NXZ6_9MAGN|nr:hypothetical protein GIB67_029467 [Kingdonia uniflora]